MPAGIVFVMSLNGKSTAQSTFMKDQLAAGYRAKDKTLLMSEKVS